MSDTTIVVVLILGVVVIVFFVVFRHVTRIRASLKGPGGMGVDVEAYNDRGEAEDAPGGPPAGGGARIEGVKAGRDAVAHDQTGEGATVKNSEVGRDAKASASPPGENPRPKP